MCECVNVCVCVCVRVRACVCVRGCGCRACRTCAQRERVLVFYSAGNHESHTDIHIYKSKMQFINPQVNSVFITRVILLLKYKRLRN